MKRNTVVGILIAIVLVVVAYFALFGQNRNTDSLSVRTGEVTQETISETLLTTGTLIPNNSQSLSGTGNVIEVNVKVGDKVTKDQQLATYDNGLTLKADIDGTITQLAIKAGEADQSMQLGKPAIQIDDLTTLKVELALASSEAAAVKLDQHAVIENGTKTYPGKVTEKDLTATTTQSAAGTTASLGAIVSFDQAPENLYAGFSVDVAITIATVENAVALPIEALTYTSDNQPRVFIINDGKAKAAKIETGIQSDTLVEVTSGLAKGETVILSPSSDVKDNTPVHVN